MTDFFAASPNNQCWVNALNCSLLIKRESKDITLLSQVQVWSDQSIQRVKSEQRAVGFCIVATSMAEKTIMPTLSDSASDRVWASCTVRTRSEAILTDSLHSLFTQSKTLIPGRRFRHPFIPRATPKHLPGLPCSISWFVFWFTFFCFQYFPVSSFFFMLLQLLLLLQILFFLHVLI